MLRSFGGATQRLRSRRGNSIWVLAGLTNTTHGAWTANSPRATRDLACRFLTTHQCLLNDSQPLSLTSSTSQPSITTLLRSRHPVRPYFQRYLKSVTMTRCFIHQPIPTIQQLPPRVLVLVHAVAFAGRVADSLRHISTDQIFKSKTARTKTRLSRSRWRRREPMAFRNRGLPSFNLPPWSLSIANTHQ